MKTRFIVYLIILATAIYSCTNGQDQNVKTDLSAIEFSEKLKTIPAAALLDVRTPGEFSKGHLFNALNIDWNGNDFDMQIAKLDKSKPVFVYCLSGGRSSSAANKMRSGGFKEVYELDGGIIQWRNANLPETTNIKSNSTGMSKEGYQKLLISDKLVLVDFHAEWCAPCKKMAPMLEEISIEKANKLQLLKIDADQNIGLVKALNIEAVPILIIYKKGREVWKHKGLINKVEMLKVKILTLAKQIYFLKI